MKKYLSHMILILTFVAPSCSYAANSSITVTATILTKNQCKLASNSATLDFGILDPVNPIDITVSTTVTFRCIGMAAMATYFITDDDGLHETGPDTNRMLHTAIPGEYISYSLNLSPATGDIPKNVDDTLTVTGVLQGVDYQDAVAGVYSDTVVVTIVP